MHTPMGAFWRRSCEEAIRLRGSVLLQGRQRRDGPPPGAAVPEMQQPSPLHVAQGGTA